MGDKFMQWWISDRPWVGHWNIAGFPWFAWVYFCAALMDCYIFYNCAEDSEGDCIAGLFLYNIALIIAYAYIWIVTGWPFVRRRISNSAFKSAYKTDNAHEQYWW